MSIKEAYKKARALYLQRLRRYKEQGYKTPEKPKTPKKITEASIRKIASLEKRLSQNIHEQKVDTGYYTKKREERRIKTHYYEIQEEKRKIKEAERLQRQALKKTTEKSKNPKRKNYKKSDIKTSTQIPKTVRDNTQNVKPPKLSDIALRRIESIIAIAISFMGGKSEAYKEAVKAAGRHAKSEVDTAIEDIIIKYLPDITKPEVRAAVSDRLYENYETNVTNLETYLYEFISDGQGALNHTDAGLAAFTEFMEVISGTEIEKKDIKKLQEALDKATSGKSYGKEEEEI